MNQCNDTIGKIDHIIVAKKGMAYKAFINNIATGNTKKLQKQIDKGTVKIYKP